MLLSPLIVGWEGLWDSKKRCFQGSGTRWTATTGPAGAVSTGPATLATPATHAFHHDGDLLLFEDVVSIGIETGPVLLHPLRHLVPLDHPVGIQIHVLEEGATAIISPRIPAPSPIT